jgi:M6 family metalloprotease-like protein
MVSVHLFFKEWKMWRSSFLAGRVDSGFGDGLTGRFARIGRLRAFVGVLLLAASPAAYGDPVFGEIFPFEQPDGTTVQVRVWGDEFYHVVESLDGYALVRDAQTGAACYARLSPDGDELVSTGVPVADRLPNGLDLQPHLRISQASAQAKVEAARARLFEGVDLDPAAMRLRAAAGPPNNGNVQGIVLLVDFSDEVGTILPSEVDSYCNQEGYTGFGNNGSVRDYFFDVSDGNLTYTNYVTPSYYRASQPKSWYDDSSVSCCSRARQLVLDALNDLDGQGFDFSQYDSNGDGFIDAINVFYAGTRNGPWNYGLWPHSGGITFSADGVSAFRYQITDMQASLALRTFAHENGHMICYWPDLYDYGYESTGVGQFCLMCYGASNTNPSEPCAYLKEDAGWATTTLLTTPQTDLPAPAGVNTVYKYEHPTRPNEYYMIENRQQSGRDAALPDAGLAIWHIDTGGSNDNEQMSPGLHYRVTLVQADGNWDLEQNLNYGDATDLWSDSGYTTCGPSTTPNTSWWDDTVPSLYVYDISAPASTMTFSFFNDCNDNAKADLCDLSCAGDCAGQPGCGSSADCQPDSVPDECQLNYLVVEEPVVPPSCSPSATDGAPWCDDFESYAPGTLGGNGWEGWGGDVGALGIVTTEQNHTAAGSQSLKIAGHDTVHVFTGYDAAASLYWLLRAWVYVPSGMPGDAYFIVNPDYIGGGAGTTWSVQLVMNTSSGTIDGTNWGGALPLETDQWVEIRCEIDFQMEQATVYYDGQFLTAGSWVGGGGSLNIGGIDLFGPGSSGFYYDDISLYPPEVYTTDCNGNTVPDLCDIAAGTSRDCNTNGVPDLCASSCAQECECYDFDVCTWDRCTGNACQYEPRTYGDVDDNTVASVLDVFCILAAIEGDYSGCTFDDADIEPCIPNGAVNLFDVFAVLGAIGGTNPCCAP